MNRFLGSYTVNKTVSDYGINISKDLVAEKVEDVCNGLEREISEVDYEKFECSISYCGTDLSVTLNRLLEYSTSLL